MQATVTTSKGAGLSGAGIATVTSVSWAAPGAAACPVLGVEVSVAVSGLPWRFNAQSYDAATDTATGQITGITATATVPELGCSVTATGPNGAPGKVNARYDNSNGVVTVTNGDMRVTRMNGDCLGMVQIGDGITFAMDLQMRPRGVLTSP